MNPSIADNGKVSLPPLGDYSSPLKDLFTGSNTAESSNFQDNIRQYNSTFFFASFKLICPLGLLVPLCGRYLLITATYSCKVGYVNLGLKS